MRGAWMRGMQRLLLAALLAWPAWSMAGLPETPRLRQFTVADGLPSDRVNDIAQDRDGYLWIATSDGLARFDGVGFRVWRTEQGLRDNFVWSVAVDAQDRVWIGTRDAGFASLDASRRAFNWHGLGTDGRGARGGEVWAIATTPDGSVWVGTATLGLHRVRGDRTDRFMPIAGNPRSLPSPAVRKLAVAPDGRLWVATDAGLSRWDGRGFVRDDPARLPSHLINGLSVDRDGAVWIGTEQGLVLRDRTGAVRAPPWRSTGGTMLQMLLRDQAGTRWFDIAGGLGIESEGAITVVPLYSDVARGLVRPTWIGARQDHEGGLWFASNTNGLWYLPPRWRQFAVLARRLDDPASLGNAQVRGIAPTIDGRIWLVGSGGTLDRLDSERGTVQHVARDVGQGMILDGVLQDRDGRIWTTYDNGIARIGADGRGIVRWSVSSADAALPWQSPMLAEAIDGAIWIAGDGGLQVREPDGRVRLRLRAGERGLPPGAVITGMARTPAGTMWLATSHGLFEWRDAALHRVPGVDASPVHGIAFDALGDAWLARFGAAEHYRSTRERLRLLARFGDDTGFPRVAPSGLVVDANGIAWATSVRGLVRVDPAARRSRVYGVRDGLPSQELAIAPVARPGDGRILIGMPEGLAVFDPAVVRPSTQAPRLQLESLDVRRGATRIALDPSTRVDLRDGDRDLRVRARLMSFNNAAANAYRFRLVGFDRGWVEGGNDGERVFSQLPPGAYRLRVIARGADQVWSAPREIAFTVHPPWWRTWWAFALGALLVTLALVSAAMVYRERLRRRHALQRAGHERVLAERASAAKTRFLATFGHEVRTPMTGVLGMTELLQDTPLDATQRGYVGAIRSAGDHLLRLLNDALDLARIDSGHLELAEEAFDLHHMLDGVAALTAPLAQRRGLDFALTIATDVPRGVIGDCSRLRQILLNLLGNASKFTERGAVRLDVLRDGDQLRFSVSDTGPGLSSEQSSRLFRRFQQADGARTAARYGGSGLGLAISTELAEAMGGRIGVDSTPGVGSRFHVDLPLREAEPDAVLETKRIDTLQPRAILLVEDDPTVADVVAGLLRAQGHRVHHVAHGLAALTEASMADYDVALLDLDLPGLDGFALAAQLRARGFTAPLIAVTARADADSEPRAFAAGFDRFVRKPVTGAMLAAALASVSERATG